MLETSICGRNWIIMRHGSWSKWYNSIMTTSDRRKHGNQETNTSHNNYSHNKTQRKQNKEISSFQFLLKLLNGSEHKFWVLCDWVWRDEKCWFKPPAHDGGGLAAMPLIRWQWWYRQTLAIRYIDTGADTASWHNAVVTLWHSSSAHLRDQWTGGHFVTA